MATAHSKSLNTSEISLLSGLNLREHTLSNVSSQVSPFTQVVNLLFSSRTAADIFSPSSLGTSSRTDENFLFQFVLTTAVATRSSRADWTCSLLSSHR